MITLHKIINWYTQRFPFPFRGWKYFRKILVRFSCIEKLYKKRLSNGLHILVQPSDHIQKEIFWYGSYEKDAIGVITSVSFKDNIILDIGANIGYFSLMLSQHVSKGHIYAFEPFSTLYNQLQNNLELNDLRNVSLLPYAVSDDSGELDLFISSTDNLGMSGLKPAENFSGQTEKVKSISIDSWLLNTMVASIDIVKIDVEGAELLVLRGMQKTIKTYQPIILIEIIKEQLANFQNTPGDIYQFLLNFEYQAFEIMNDHTIKEISGIHEGYSILFLPSNYELPSNINIAK